MASRTSDTQALRQARSIVLAEQAHLTGRARFIGRGTSGEALWEVPSKTVDGGVYLVKVWPLTGITSCNCTAGSFHQACGHAGAAILADRQRRQALAYTHDDPFGWWRAGGEW
jgi:hypothetical protein